jgi:lipopolysaccharide export system permease protein
LPELIVYTLPVTFFIAVAMAILKLSIENELIVMFALTMSPKKIAKIFFFVSLIVSLFLLINSIIFIPISKQLNKNFIQYKKLEARVNIKPTEFGQKFDGWSIFVNEADERGYSQIILYNPKDERGSERFIVSNRAKIDNNNSIISIILDNGKLYSFGEESVEEIEYDSLKLSYKPDISDIKFDRVVDYWQKAKINKTRAKDLSINILISFFPLVTFLFAISFGVFNARHERSNIYLLLFAVVLIYYLFMYAVSLKAPLFGTPLLILLFFAASNLYFKKRVLSRY